MSLPVGYSDKSFIYHLHRRLDNMTELRSVTGSISRGANGGVKRPSDLNSLGARLHDPHGKYYCRVYLFGWLRANFNLRVFDCRSWSRMKTQLERNAPN